MICRKEQGVKTRGILKGSRATAPFRSHGVRDRLAARGNEKGALTKTKGSRRSLRAWDIPSGKGSKISEIERIL